MALSKWTLIPTSLLVFYAYTSQGQSNTDRKTHISSDKAFTISYPSTWKENKAEAANAEFCINAPGAGLLSICMIKMQINGLSEVSENSDIHQLSEAELKMLQTQPNDQMKFEILESSFKILNEHEWWIIHGTITVGNKVFFTDSYKSIHSKKAYVLTYFSNEKNYTKNKEAAEKIFSSLEFLTKNTSVSNSSAKIANDAPVDSKIDKNNNVPSPAKTNSPAASIAKKEKSHTGIFEIDFLKEPEYIKEYGDGKVKRLSEHQIEVTLTTGKKRLLEDPYNVQNKYYESLGCFIGYSDELNSFILAQQGGGGLVKLVNRTTGEISDDIFLNEIEENNNAPAALYGSLNLHKAWSADRKWLAIERISDGEDDMAMELVIYAVQSTFRKKYKNKFEVLSFQNSNIKTQHWEPGELTWLDNNTLEIKKIRRIGGLDKEKVIGSTWLTLQNGKWVFASTKPPIKKEGDIAAAPTATAPEYSAPNSPAKPELVPSVKDRIFTGGKTMDELGQKLLQALKTNDKKLWYSCVYEDTYEEVSARFEKLREMFAEKGIANWNQVKYVRTIFAKGFYCKECVYQDIKVEFEYKNPLVGFYKNLGGIVLYKEKYLLREATGGDTHVYRPN